MRQVNHKRVNWRCLRLMRNISVCAPLAQGLYERALNNPMCSQNLMGSKGAMSLLRFRVRVRAGFTSAPIAVTGPVFDGFPRAIYCVWIKLQMSVLPRQVDEPITVSRGERNRWRWKPDYDASRQQKRYGF